ncbi:hypothetical protein [Halotia branconii]|uniref:Uncharacterized protein n=1 Tax=Halotia branconii CENA392 TaxID=1539056 RepID=A0AAJ6PBJ7_9CYAN|nr:hypothetical protein [Halotia branconii]WGV27896.1 hypothetical protein QI031_10615 [Halotia branconii CENA392]
MKSSAPENRDAQRQFSQVGKAAHETGLTFRFIPSWLFPAMH